MHTRILVLSPAWGPQGGDCSPSWMWTAGDEQGKCSLSEMFLSACISCLSCWEPLAYCQHFSLSSSLAAFFIKTYLLTWETWWGQILKWERGLSEVLCWSSEAEIVFLPVPRQGLRESPWGQTFSFSGPSLHVPLSHSFCNSNSAFLPWPHYRDNFSFKNAKLPKGKNVN